MDRWNLLLVVWGELAVALIPTRVQLLNGYHSLSRIIWISRISWWHNSVGWCWRDRTMIITFVTKCINMLSWIDNRAGWHDLVRLNLRWIRARLDLRPWALLIQHLYLARDFTTLATVATLTATCPVAAFANATAQAYENHEDDKGWNSVQEQIPPDVVNADKSFLPPRVLFTCDLEAKGESGL